MRKNSENRALLSPKRLIRGSVFAFYGMLSNLTRLNHIMHAMIFALNVVVITKLYVSPNRTFVV